MSKETFTIPVGQAARYEFQTNAIERCVANATAWGIPADKITNIVALQADYDSKYAITSNRSTQSPAATVSRDASWDLLEVALDYMYTHYLLNNDAISVSDKEALHIHNTSGGGAPTPAPTSSPIVSLTSEEISALHVIYSDPSAPGKHYKPGNVAFCEVWYKIDAPAPVSPSECLEHVNISRSHEPIQFEPEQRGKTVYGFARWVNRNGKTGPWSSSFSAMIP